MALTHLFVRQVGLQTALLARVAQEGGEGPQAEVVVVLSGQLLHGQRVQRVHLLGQNLGAETERGTLSAPETPLLRAGMVTDGRKPALGPEAAGTGSVDSSSGKIAATVLTRARGRPPSPQLSGPHILLTTASVPCRIS